MRVNNIFRFGISALAFLTIITVASITSLGQTVSPKTNTDPLMLKPTQEAKDTKDEDDDKLDESFRKYGSAAGAAYQCTAPADREKMVSEVMRAYSRIGQLFGTDRAFYFAVHFGNSVEGPFDKTKCNELLKKLRESVLVRRTAQ